jgi:hypothetical protein
MLYFVQQKRGVRPYWRLNVVLCATFLTMFPGLKPIFAQIVAQNATFPFLWCKEAGKCCILCRICRHICPGKGSANAEFAQPTCSSNVTVKIRTLTWSSGSFGRSSGGTARKGAVQNRHTPIYAINAARPYRLRPYERARTLRRPCPHQSDVYAYSFVSISKKSLTQVFHFSAT